MRIIYRASPTFKKVHRSNALVKAIRGPIGSGKSVGCVKEMWRICLNQEPNAQGVRKTRWACVRNTYPELKGTVIKTFQAWIPPEVCPIKYDSPITGKLNIPHPDGKTRVEAEFLFLSMDKPKDVKKLMSLELTGVWINEAQFLPVYLVTEAVTRTGRYPEKKKEEGFNGATWNGMIMDTNSPDDDHWWYQFEQGVDEETGEPLKPKGWDFFVQPGALVDITNTPDNALTDELKEMLEEGQYTDYLGHRFVANPLAENVENHKKEYGYWFDNVQGQTLNWIKSRVCNEFATVQQGKPVFVDHFNKSLHVAKDKLLPVKGWATYIGLDFGLTPAAIIGQITSFGQLRITDEVVATGMGIERFIQEQLIPLIKAKYQDCDIQVIGDPAGVQRAQTDEKTCFQILYENGLNAMPASSNSTIARLEAVRWWLSRLVNKGQPAMLISPHCKTLIKGYETGYAYKKLNVAGDEKYTENPDKNRYSHPHDANQYLCLNTMPDKIREQIINIKPQSPLSSKTGY
ncbi:TerL [Gallibacterium genomosp. 1]|uniref:TerL n=1 Tax=Gallibacterium genomosp. 1 TaxID=155515 RepID=UPI0008027B4A|nr:TerL [Gallibacterium genomosp. 1]OBX02210.1 TerL [Gallibacterium genomosp. 1]